MLRSKKLKSRKSRKSHKRLRFRAMPLNPVELSELIEKVTLQDFIPILSEAELEKFSKLFHEGDAVQRKNVLRTLLLYDPKFQTWAKIHVLLRHGISKVTDEAKEEAVEAAYELLRLARARTG